MGVITALMVGSYLVASRSRAGREITR
jgi:hypothetical protein